MVTNQKIEETFMLQPLFLNRLWCLSLSYFQQEDRHLCKIVLHLHQSLYPGVHFLQFLNYLACKCLKMLQLILSQVFQIRIISLEDNNLQDLLQTLGTTSDATKKDTFGTILAWQIIIKANVWLCFSCFVIYFRYCINLTNIDENF